MMPTETAQEIAARYGATARPGLKIQRVQPGVSGMAELIWHDKKGLIYAVKPSLQRLIFTGRPPQPCMYRGVQYPSLTSAALANAVTLAAVSKAIRKAKERRS